MTSFENGWHSAVLSDVCDVAPRDPPLSPDAPFVPMDAVTIGERWPSYYETRGARSGVRAQAGDVLFARITPCLENGKLAQVPPGTERVGGSTEFIVVRPGDLVDEGYLYYWCMEPSVRSKAKALMAGATGRMRLGATDLGQFRIPLPPLDEQRRIVALLEDHLSRLDAAQAGLAVAARRAERLRWSTAMAQVRKAGGTEVRLGDIADVRNGIFVSRAGTEPDGIPILRIGAVRSLSLDLSDLRYSRRDESDLRAADALALPGNLLFTRYNGNPQFVGACAVVPSDAPTLTYPDKLIRVRITDDDALPSFVALACSVGGARARIQAAVRTTAGQAGISGRDLKAVTLLLPDCDAQRSAVAATNDADVAVRRLSDAISSGQHRKVARSLLAAAFSGQLTAETATA